MNEDEQVIWGQPISFQDFVQGFQAAPNQRKVEFIPKADPQKFYVREKVASPSQDQGEIRDANKERVNRSLSNYASNNFLLSTSNIRPDQNGRYNPGLGQFAGDQTALTLSMGFDPFNTSNYYKVATQIPKFRNWGLTRLLANELNNEVRVAGELGKNVGSVPTNTNNLFRATVYKGGEITDPYSTFFTTDPKYASNYGKVTPYTFESKNVVKTTEPLMGYSDPVNMDMFVYNNTRSNPKATAIIGNDKVTGEFIPSQGMEILSLTPRNFTLKSVQEPKTSLRFFTKNPKLAKTLTDEQWDAGYLPAVKNKDLVEAQTLRDLHFGTKSGNDNMVFAHTTPNSFTVFDKSYFGRTDNGFNGKGFYFSTTRIPEGPINYKGIRGPRGEIPTMNYGKNKMYVYLKGNREFDIGNSERNFFNEPDVVGVAGKTFDGKPHEVIIGNPNNIKLTDVITYDNQKNIIPLSMRDNFINPDIRYQNGGKITE